MRCFSYLLEEAFLLAKKENAFLCYMAAPKVIVKRIVKPRHEQRALLRNDSVHAG